MDTLKQIYEKISSIKDEEVILDIKIIIRHIERAEKFYRNGMHENDSHYFTDVIYRTNQAFEGILKAAYESLAGDRADRKTPYEIEQYFLDNSILHSRVLDLFKNYRTEWRNPSTHNYKLVFTEEEAYLAILSVTSFINLLLNQIIEKLSYLVEQELLKKAKIDVIKSIPNYTNLDLLHKVENILIKFADYLKNDKIFKTEPELLGALDAYIKMADPSILLIREPLYSISNKTFRPDFVLKTKNEELLLEVKKEYRAAREELIQSQLRDYMWASKIKYGIGYFYTSNENKLYESKISSMFDNGHRATICIIYPK